MKPECFNSRNWETGSCEPVCLKRTISPPGLFPIWYAAEGVSCDKIVTHAGRTDGDTWWEMQSVQGICLHLRHALSSFQVKFFILSWTYLAFQPFFFLSQLLYFSTEGPSRGIILVLNIPFSGQKNVIFCGWLLTSSVRGISGSTHSFPFSKDSSSDNQSKILPVTMAGEG